MEQNENEDKDKGAYVISFMSAKGGVGKSSMAANIANFCSHYGKKVLLIDGDLNTNGATIFLNTSRKFLGNKNVITFRDILSGIPGISSDDNSELKKYIEADMQTSVEDFKFIPASLEILDVKEQDNIEKNYQDNKEKNVNMENQIKFRKIFECWKGKHELIIFDLAAGYNNFNDFIGGISDRICIIAEEGEVSLAAVRNCYAKVIKRQAQTKIVGCFNKHTSKKNNTPFQGFAFDYFYGLENTREYLEKFNRGELLDPEKKTYGRVLNNIAEGLDIKLKKLEERKEKQQEEKSNCIKKIRKKILISIIVLILLFFIAAGFYTYGNWSVTTQIALGSILCSIIFLVLTW